MNTISKNKTVAVIGAGPIGLAAAAHLKARGLEPLVLERGERAGHAIDAWGHVRVFTPWRYLLDSAATRLLELDGWTKPESEHLPTGREIVDEYLLPLASSPELRSHIRYGAKVTAIAKRGLSKSASADRDSLPFTIHYQIAGEMQSIEADAVIDASGTWFSPNPIGADGVPIIGEQARSDRIDYGIPDVLTRDRARFEGKRTFVLGGGHSAINLTLDLLRLKQQSADTKVIWGLRRNNLAHLLGGGINDQLPARGALGLAAKEAIDAGALQLLAPLSVDKIERDGEALKLQLLVDGEARTIQVDRVVVATGFRPDLAMLRELRLDLDQIVEAPSRLAPLIDPNLHSCGTVPPHGVVELSHPDKNFFIVGMKAYGRAPTFLMLTGYEQVRSIADELAGRSEAARHIELNLPQTGVCNGAPSSDDADVVDSDVCCGLALETASAKRCCG